MLIRVLVSLLLLVSLASAGVTVSSPAAGSTNSSPVHFVAKATSSSSSVAITAMHIYVDNVSIYAVSANALDTSLALSSGSHAVTVQAWDAKGAVYKSALNITVQSGTVIPANAKVFSKVEEMTNWQSCDACAGAGGAGPPTPHWMAQFETSPALDGASTEFFVGGSNPYGAALWWKQLGPIDTATHFVYDMNFYFKDATAPQALEFDMNQSVNGKKYIFGSECDFHLNKTWRIWDTKLKWQDTGVSCVAAHTALKWHSLRWEFERTSGGQMHYIAVTVDGVRHLIGKFYNPQASSVRELNVAFQMDGNSTMTDYHVWVDKVKLSVW
ncbi:MAG: hypothetical protein ACJ71N_01035 [Terriglobales bacterium]|jgi:hypothetical protein